ncbi:MAG TPA: aminotransferase class I/II-fold pyridoxal phosphate-dependent enzyme, partial [Candidatus Saccharimonadales bacterium]|nr:aminotransferase class I/II-fold pyridoxal phosphate-dependent enzyme [Candidatus Saccharimonadales bacterium]
MKYKIPFIKPELPPAEDLIDCYKQIVDSNWFSNFGPLEQKLCKNAENYIGQGVFVTTVSNATTGLMLAIKTLMKPKPGQKQVLVPAFTFAAGPEAIIWCGLEPVFIDVNRQTWQPNLDQAQRYLQENQDQVAGILFCNIFGVGAPEIDRWENLAQEFGVPLIIDSAAGFGSEYEDGNKLGGKGDCEVFSFHVTKPFGV